MVHFFSAKWSRQQRGSRRNFIALGWAFAALFQTYTAHASTTVGATPGSHQVTSGGAFTYIIPLVIPPGIAGIEPKLSLLYSSQGGNGIAGVGWSLTGLTAIARCGHSIVQDGANRGIQFDAADRFCLDGQRLVAINGVYGAVGTEYRTETESFTRVVSVGGTAGNPEYFKAWTKSGHIIEYGNTPDSRLETQSGTTAISWVISRLSDTLGNYMTFSYLEDRANGESLLERIDYTGNETANTSPNNSVQFTYEFRLDSEGSYIGSQLFKSPKRLAKVESFAGNTAVRAYQLTYASQTTANDASRIIEIESCSSTGDCLGKTKLEWDVASHANSIATARWSYVDSWLLVPVAITDVNGDGRGDLIVKRQINGGTPSYEVLYSTGAGFSGSISLGTVKEETNGDSGPVWPPYPAVGDLNGDGRADLIVTTGWMDWYTGDASNNVLLSTGSGFVRARWSYVDSWLLVPVAITDVNGDGRGDLIVKRQINGGTPSYEVLYSTGAGFSAPVLLGAVKEESSGDYGSVWPPHPVIGDLNGDGRADLIVTTGWMDWYTGDASNNVLLSTGSGFVRARWSYVDSWLLVPVAITDVNGDGRGDLIVKRQINGGTPSYEVLYSTGAGFSGSISLGTVKEETNGDSGPVWPPYPAVGDLNGDGRADLIIKTSWNWGGSNANNIVLSNPGQPDSIRSIETGLNSTIAVTYKSLTDGSVHTKGSGAAYPYVDVQAPLYVVSSISQSDGLGGSHVIDYTYAGAKSHQLGGGFLGFREVSAHDPQAHLRSITTYRQDYPYHGQPLTSQKLNDSNVLLSQSTITYLDQIIDTSKSPTWHRSLPSRTVESSYELNGGLVSTVITDTQYDTYGNPTSIVVNSGGGYSKTTTNLYDNIVDDNRWFLGRLRRSIVNSVAP